MQGYLLRGLDIWSGAAYKGLKSPFDNSFVTSDFDPYGISKNYNINTLCDYEIINKFYYQNQKCFNHFVSLENIRILLYQDLGFSDIPYARHHKPRLVYFLPTF